MRRSSRPIRRSGVVALKRRNANVASISRLYQQIRAQDYFNMALGVRGTRGDNRDQRRAVMKWVTWENVGVDRMGCAWLIQQRIDPEAEFVFLPEGSAELPGNAEPFDIPGTRLSHHHGHCSFHAILRQYKIKDAVLDRIAAIVDEADVVQEAVVEPAAAGLDLLCRGTRLKSKNDTEALARGTLIYDALYAALAAEIMETSRQR